MLVAARGAEAKRCGALRLAGQGSAGAGAASVTGSGGDSGRRSVYLAIAAARDRCHSSNNDVIKGKLASISAG